MGAEGFLPSETFSTLFTWEGFDSGVNVHVVGKVCPGCEALSAQCARVRLFSRVNSLVSG